MDPYQVQHRYAAYRDGQQIGPWAEGDQVELSTADAEWVNRDSPGTLLAAGGVIKAVADGPARQKPAGANRQHRGSPNRGK
ncbi:hypothetical protein [Actinoplanes sp. NPDC049118]|uniref:hypothetical protein n=1 Tax=Actinoplanes sp. NPDC049118 TaxID=3155769 RepID=UPI0033EEE011